MRKGSTEMWWIIIGAVIALVVLIILLVLFTGKTQPLAAGLSECEGKGGLCLGLGTDKKMQCPGNTLQSGAFSCPNQQEVCCVGFPQKCETIGIDVQNCGVGKSCVDYGNNHKYCS